MHIEWIAFYLLYKTIVNKSRQSCKSIALLLIIFSLFVCQLVDCATGIVGIVIFLIILFLPRKIVINPWVWLVSLLSSTSFALFYQELLNISWVRYIIIDVLHRSTDLTGRIYIYERLPIILNDHWTYGYGYASDYETWHMFGYNIPNFQNAVASLTVENGLIVAIIYLLLAFYIIKKANNKEEVFILVSIIYTLTFLGTVEITFTINFLALLILIFYISKFYRKLQ